MLEKLDARSSARKSYNLMLEAWLDSSICWLVKAWGRLAELAHGFGVEWG